jgi:cell shape-determining protein MreC
MGPTIQFIVLAIIILIVIVYKALTRKSSASKTEPVINPVIKVDNFLANWKKKCQEESFAGQQEVELLRECNKEIREKSTENAKKIADLKNLNK